VLNRNASQLVQNLRKGITIEEEKKKSRKNLVVQTLEVCKHRESTLGRNIELNLNKLPQKQPEFSGGKGETEEGEA